MFTELVLKQVEFRRGVGVEVVVDLVDVFRCTHLWHSYSSKAVTVFLVLDRSRRVVLQMRDLLVVMTEVVVLNELQLVLLLVPQALGASLAPFALLSFSALAIFLVIFESKWLLRTCDCIRR